MKGLSHYLLDLLPSLWCFLYRNKWHFFKISFSIFFGCLCTPYTTDLSAIPLYLEALVNKPINSNYLSVGSFGFSTYTIMSSVNTDSFIPFQLFLFIYSAFLLFKHSSTTLNKNADGVDCLTLDFKCKAFKIVAGYVCSNHWRYLTNVQLYL